MSSSVPSPETDKSRKYDRQIRLWGDHGQSLLENSQICLVNANALGTEILKGLVLPGIGSFTIIDHNLVTDEDIGCNFFLEPSSLGQSRAKHCTKFLQELNPDVNGESIDDNIDTIIANNPEFFKNFSVVVSCGLNEKSLIKLSNLLWELNIPFMSCQSVGFLGSARIQMKEHCVIETHPDNKHQDLRLEEAFQTLEEHVSNIKLGPKVPWLIILYKNLEVYRKKHDRKIPNTYKEKSELRDIIRSSMTADEENFEEAIRSVNSSFGGGKVNSEVQKILNDSCCINLNKNSSPFWIMARGLKDFIEKDGKGYLPLPGTIPDMTADTSLYINLQNIYRAKAIQDADAVFRRVQQLLKELNKSSDWISEKDVRLFCREAAYISVTRGSKISDEYEKGSKTSMISDELENPDSLISHYVVLRAMERFQTEHGYIPGEVNVETDPARIKSLATRLVNDWGISSQLNDDLFHEICRYGGAEIHSISSFLGGCCAHEIIKLVTRQYKPFDNTIIYDGIKSQSETFKF
ncbi:CLUMA_CG015393, isoform A [Clunio marinus]|uniref:NEDD8-activating enzyme E1 regulatory subunit n=1 Tax=Clunio marinus TaxID=568069 RepID=A0A1J1IPP2_9DIPT|nr:CLUMA_CG015393, isoform A [Clunio marinus]